MRKIKILLDIIALITFFVGMIMGMVETKTWLLIAWVIIALMADIELYQNEDND